MGSYHFQNDSKKLGSYRMLRWPVFCKSTLRGVKYKQKIDKPVPCTPEPLLLAGGVKSQFLKSS
jgi:hypothetical protein